jgi:hypothetical protein
MPPAGIEKPLKTGPGCKKDRFFEKTEVGTVVKTVYWLFFLVYRSVFSGLKTVTVAVFQSLAAGTWRR